MYKYIQLTSFILLAIFLSLSCGQDDFAPTKVHISYGDAPTQMIITWSTLKNASSIVQYGLRSKRSGIKYFAYGSSTAFRQQYIHRVYLKNVVPGGNHIYNCGSKHGWSKQFTFQAMKSGVNWSPSFLVFGDMGLVNARSLPWMEKDVKTGMYDALHHVGDIAYNMQEESGHLGDKFQDMVEPLSANLPYMMTPGNHDIYKNYSEYTNRFSTPGDQKGLFYSYDIGPAHIISIATGFYYFYWGTTGFQQMAIQYDWLIKDLQEANKPENRAARPWIIILGHKPMYCSNADGDDCTWGFPRTRVGVPFLHWFGIEKPLWKYGVDIAIWAHEHSYERLWPIYNKKIYNGTYEHPYINPKATVHLTSGSAGCREGENAFVKNVPYYTAFRSLDYGYSRMKIVNKTHMNWQQVSVGKAGGVIDNFWIVQTKHGSFEKSSKKA